MYVHVYIFDTYPFHTMFFLGLGVLAQYTDNRWYRAEVLQSSTNERDCTVQYVDFGTTETLKLSRIRAIPEECKPIVDTPARVCIPMNGDEGSLTKWNLCFPNLILFFRLYAVPFLMLYLYRRIGRTQSILFPP